MIIVPFKERVKFANLIDLSPTFDAKSISEPIPEKKRRETIALELLHGALTILYSSMISMLQEGGSRRIERLGRV